MHRRERKNKYSYACISVGTEEDGDTFIKDIKRLTMDGENRIVLNVGGIRFETYKVSWSIFNEIHQLMAVICCFLVRRRSRRSRPLDCRG